MIKEVIVVEGKADTQAIRRVVDAETIETNGSALSEETQRLIKQAAQTRGIIVFTDPDFNGERLRKIITNIVPDAKHAFLTKDEAGRQIKHHSLGIEYATDDTLIHALSELSTVAAETYQSDITKADLMRLGLLAGPAAAQNRQAIAEALNLGYVNGKQLLKRLEMFGITYAELEQTLTEIRKES
ncbi:ribonuclease M5 [Weissella tructae]|jgi:ribonuclease M5|uniref:Ribonuclease M5 n=2 Tax=Weissella TaxID=46255 RepID=A0A075TY72_9LACO|nr:MULTISPECIES: ribonuclease M5 [Weissella]AIG65165.1 Ribonuclease M5 [Weissella tructae]AIM62478.1 Ribonuclease M5 [Weissella ceti]AIM63815.1 Ribonuclease M5 [Weissella ceti]ELA07952.1 ribonuclease M5 [Weissella ceti NC36]QVV91550.1 ribonuclease M5 [Weissella tructae]